MSTRVIGYAANCIGDVPNITIAYTAPTSAPTAEPDSVEVSALKPDGTPVAATPAVGSGLSWVWTAADPIDQAGVWRWRVVASGALVDASEFSARIPDSPFP